MRLIDAFYIPEGMDFLEYEKLMNEKEKLERQIRTASNTIFEEDDSLDVLADEVGSERYNKHLERKQRAIKKRKNAEEKLDIIMKKLNR